MGSGLGRRPHLIGKMREQLTPIIATSSEDNIGGRTIGEANGTAFFAQVVPAGARERFKYAHLDKVISHTVFCRYDPALTRGVTVLWGTRRLYIEAVQQLSAREVYMELACVETGSDSK